MHMNPPLLRLELEGMKHTILTLLGDQAGLLNKEFEQAVEDYCTPENLEHIIREQTATSIEAAIKEEIRNFYLYGKGRAVIKAAVIMKLGEDANA